MNENKTPAQGRFLKTLSPLAVWALAFGCSVGWGSFVMPGTTFLPTAGALGAVIGILIGALVMLLIGVSYHFLMNQYPERDRCALGKGVRLDDIPNRQRV